VLHGTDNVVETGDKNKTVVDCFQVGTSECLSRGTDHMEQHINFCRKGSSASSNISEIMNIL